MSEPSGTTPVWVGWGRTESPRRIQRSTLAAGQQQCTSHAVRKVADGWRGSCIDARQRRDSTRPRSNTTTIDVDETVRILLRERARRRLMVLMVLILAFAGFAMLSGLMYLDHF